MHRFVAFLGVMAIASLCASSPSVASDLTRPVLTIRAQTTSYNRVVGIVKATKSAVGGPIEIEMEMSGDGQESIDVRFPDDTPNLDRLVSTIFVRLFDLGVRRISIVGEVAERRREYSLLSSLADAERLEKANAPFILWFHADWAMEAVILQHRILRDTELLGAIGLYRIPLVRVDHTHPTDSTNEALSEHSKSRYVPTVVIFAMQRQGTPTVLYGQVLSREVLDKLKKAANDTAPLQPKDPLAPNDW